MPRILVFCLPATEVRRNAAGFTLIEVLVVLLLMALLASVVGPGVLRALEGAVRRGELADAEAFLRRMPERVFQQARTTTLDAESLPSWPDLPGQLGQWQVRRAIVFTSRGSCSGGEVAFRPSMGDGWVVFTLAPVTCVPQRFDPTGA